MSYKQHQVIQTKKKINNSSNINKEIIQTSKSDKSKLNDLFKANIIQTSQKTKPSVNKEKVILNNSRYNINPGVNPKTNSIYSVNSEFLTVREDVYIRNLLTDSLTVNELIVEILSLTSGTISDTPINDNDITNKLYVDTAISNITDVNLITGTISSAPVNPNDITNKAYVDSVAGGGGGAPVGASYITVSSETGLTSERVLTGTPREIETIDNGAGSTFQLKLPSDLIILGGLTPFFPPGATMNGNLLLGRADFQSGNQELNIVMSEDGISSKLLGFNCANLYNGIISTNADSQNVNCITFGNNTLNGLSTSTLFIGSNNVNGNNTFTTNSSIIGNSNNINLLSSINNSLIVGSSINTTGDTITYTDVLQSLVYGNNITINSDANVTNSIIGGSNITVSSNIQNGCMVSGGNHTINGQMVSGANILGFDITNSNTLTASSLIGSFINKSGTSRINIFGDNHESTSTESAGNRRGVVIASGFPDVSSLYYKAGGSLTQNTNWGATAGEDIIGAGSPLNGNGNIHIISNNLYFGGITNGTTYFRDRRPRCQESLYPTTNTNDLASKGYVDSVAGAPTTASYITVNSEAGLTSERILTETTREITITDGGAGGNLTIGLDDIIHIGNIGNDNYSSTGVDDALIILGEAQLQGTANKRRSIVSGGTANVVNGTASITDCIHMGLGNITGGIHNASFFNHTSAMNVSCTSSACHFMGSGTYSGGTKTWTLFIGDNGTSVSAQTEAAILGGYNVDLNGALARYGSIIFGRDINQTAGNIENGVSIFGNDHTISNSIQNGAGVLGNNNTISSSLTNGRFIVGNGITHSGGAQITTIGDNHISATLSGAGIRRGLVLAVEGVDASSVYYDGASTAVSQTSNSNWGPVAGETTGGGLGSLSTHIITPNLFFGGNTNGATYFRDRRPRCQESLYPTTLGDDLASKIYADSVFMLSLYGNPVSGDFIGINTGTYATVSVPVAAASTIRKISIIIQTAPSAGQASSFILYKNNVAVGGGTIIITISNTDLTGNITLSEPIAENDTIAIEYVGTGSAASPGAVRITVYFAL